MGWDEECRGVPEMSLRPTHNRFDRGGLVTPPPESITPELEAVVKYVAPLTPAEQDREDCVTVITSQIPAALKAMQEEVLAQALGFTFAARRYGDFLMIEMERKANDEKQAKQKFATTINLGKVDRISVRPGSDVTLATRTFALETYLVSRHQHGQKFADYYAEHPPISIPTWRPFIKTEEMSLLYGNAVWGGQRGHNYQEDNYICVKNVPHLSEDDLLVFHGNESFHLPFQRGEAVLIQVMLAIEKGWEQQSLSSLTLKDALA